MPELPEVEVVRAGLAPAVTGARIASVTVFDERSLRRHPGPLEDFVERLTGRRMLAAVRRGKFLWLPLESPPSEPEAIVAHLGMSGQVLLRAMDAVDPLTRIRLELTHPQHGDLRLNFVDQRIFGSMAIDDLVPTTDGEPGGAGYAAALVPTKVAHIARDPLDAAFDDSLFFARLARKNVGIKRVLLDQTLISGIGNIYADEALWRARLHYARSTDTLRRAEVERLLDSAAEVMSAALAAGGTSFDALYVNVNGQSGYFDRSLAVYGQAGRPCPRCGTPIIRTPFMNRSSHHCPTCQPPPRPPTR